MLLLINLLLPNHLEFTAYVLGTYCPVIFFFFFGPSVLNILFCVFIVSHVAFLHFFLSCIQLCAAVDVLNQCSALRVISFLVTTIGKYIVILGFPWMHRRNPQISLLLTVSLLSCIRVPYGIIEVLNRGTFNPPHLVPLLDSSLCKRNIATLCHLTPYSTTQMFTNIDLHSVCNRTHATQEDNAYYTSPEFQCLINCVLQDTVHQDVL